MLVNWDQVLAWRGGEEEGPAGGGKGAGGGVGSSLQTGEDLLKIGYIAAHTPLEVWTELGCRSGRSWGEKMLGKGTRATRGDKESH